jgi:uncharacterized membrane protein
MHFDWYESVYIKLLHCLALTAILLAIILQLSSNVLITTTILTILANNH